MVYHNTSSGEPANHLLAFEQVFESLPILYLLLSPDLYIVNASNDYLQATLSRREHIVGKYIFEAFPDNPAAPEANAMANVRASLEQVLLTRQPHQMPRQRYDVPHPQEPGSFVVRYWLPTHTPVLNQQGEVSFIIQHLVDTTESVQVEEQLQVSQHKEKQALAEAQRQRARFEKFLLEIPAAICVFAGPDFVYDFVNPRYQQQLFPGRKILGKPLFEAVPEIIDQPIAQVLREVYQTGKTSEGKEVLIPLAHDDGGPLVDHYFNYIQQARYNEKGEIDGIMTFAYDITELVLARKALEQRELALQELNNELEAGVASRTQELKLAQAEAESQKTRLETLFMQAPAPIVILDGPDLVYELVNPAYQQIFPGRQLLGKPLLEALPEVVNTPISSILKRVYQTGETFIAQEMPLWLARREGGPLEEIFWTFTYQARRTGQGTIDGIMVFAHEVTDQVHARKVVEESAQQAQTLAQELARANEELWVANQEKQAANEELGLINQQLTRTNIDLDNFIYTASHDLKAPILNIEGLLHILTPEFSQAAEVQPVLDMMQESVKRFKQTISDLTEVTKLQRATEPVSLVNLAAVVQEVTLDLQPQLKQAQAKLMVEVGACPAFPFSVKNLRSIVYNLLSNAIKYRSPERDLVVKIHCREEETDLVLTVQDNGLGMNLTQDTPLFSMFHRLHDHVEGSGLGLFMVKRIIENAHGSIAVASRVGEGSTFTLRFPKS